MLSGMTIDQFSEVAKFATRNHGFYRFDEESAEGEECEIPEEKKLNHKYIECRYDSRDGEIWTIIFYGGFSPDVAFACNHWRIPREEKEFTYTTLFDWVMAYLKREWIPKENFYARIKRNASLEHYEEVKGFEDEGIKKHYHP